MFRVRLLLIIALSGFCCSLAKGQLVAAFSSNHQSGCAPLLVLFTDQSTGSPSSWLWDFGNGNTSILQNPAAIYGNPGTYTVTLTVTNGGGSNTIVRTNYIHVFQNPNAAFSGLGTLSGCIPITVNFADNSTPGDGAINTWLWDFGDGATSTLQNPAHTYNTAGSFTVRLRIFDANGCTDTLIVPNYVRTSALPVPNFLTSPASSCNPPFNVSFTSVVNGSSPPFTYFWRFGDGSTSTLPNPSHLYASIGLYNVTLIVRDANGCTDSVIHYNAVNIGPIIAQFQPSDTLACEGQVISFANSTVGQVVNWNWNFGDGSSSNLMTPSHSYAAPGYYTVKLVATGPNGCSDSITHVVHIYDFFANFHPDTLNGCTLPFVVNFIDSSLNAVSWQWNFGDSTAASYLQNPTHIYTVEGDFTVTLLILTADGCVDTFTFPQQIHVHLPLAEIDPDTLRGCLTLTVHFIDSSISYFPITSWQWDFGDGSTSTQQNPTHTYTSPGMYTATLTITNSLGCTSTALVVVNVGSPPVTTVTTAPLIICPKDSIHFTSHSTPGVNEWMWYFGDGESQNWGPNAIHSYDADTGFFSLTLITCDTGCCDTLFVPNVAYVLPAVARINASHTHACTAPDTIQFSNLSILADSIFWKFGDGTTSGMQNPTHIYTQEGIYRVTLYAWNFSTGCLDSTFETIIIAPAHAPFGSLNSSWCAPVTAQFLDTLYNVHVAWFWDFGDGTTSTVNNPSHTYSTGGRFTVSLSVVDPFGCTATRTRPAYVLAGNPDAQFSGLPLSGCVPVNVSFTDLSTSFFPINSWFWDFGDGNNSALQNPQHNYPVAINPVVQLRIVDSLGCTDNINSQDIHVYDPQAMFSVLDSNTCPTVNTQFNNLSTGTGLQYVWDFGDGSSSTATSPGHSYGPGSYVPTLTVTDTIGCTSSFSAPFSMHVQNMNAGFTANPTLASCPPLLVHFTDNSVFNPVAWEWRFGDGTFSALQNPSHLYTSNGSFDVRLIVHSATGCTDTIEYLNLINLLGPGGTVNFNPGQGCMPVTVSFFANTWNVQTFYWDFGDGTVTSSSTGNIAHTYTQPGVFHPIIILDDGQGCTFPIVSPDSIVVDTVLQAGFTANSTFLCGTGPVNFTDLSISQQPITIWNWSFGDGGTSIAQNPTHVYQIPGLYTVRLIVVNAFGCRDTIIRSQYIDVNPPIAARISVSDTAGCNPLIVTFMDSSFVPGGLASRNWDFGNGQTGTAATQSITFTPASSYVTTLTVTDLNGCSSALSKTIQVYPEPTAVFAVDDSVGCVPFLVQFTGGNNSGITSWSWDFGDGSTGTGAVVSHTYINSGRYDIRLAVETVNGCKDTLILPSRIYAGTIHADYTYGPARGCLPFPVVFRDSSVSDTSLVTWNWNFGDGNSSSIQNPTHVFSQSGLFPVWLTVTDAAGCVDSVTRIVAEIYDTIPPPAPEIQRVTVLNETSIHLNWKRYNGTEFVRYVIYLESSPGGGIFAAMDSVSVQSDTFYVMQGLNTLDHSCCFKVQAVDYCGLRSDLDSSLTHCSMNVEASPGIDRIEVDWSHYSGWNAVQNYGVYRVNDWNPINHILIGFVPGNTTHFTDSSLKCFQPYFYRILATQSGGGTNQSWSDTSGAVSVHFPNTLPGEVVTATVEADRDVRVEWKPAPVPAIEFYVWRSADAQNWTQVATLPFHTFSFLDPQVEVMHESFYYRITFLDSCDAISPYSNHGQNVVLKAWLADHLPQLEWSMYSEWKNGVDHFNLEVHNDATNQWEFLASVPATTQKFTDHQTNFPQQFYHYRVWAVEKNGNSALSLSNTAAVEVFPRIFAPNAFSPNGDGINDRLLFKGRYIKEFTVHIYSRWGELIYEGNDMQTGWDGLYQGKPCQEDVYHWVINAVGVDDKEILLKGSAHLLK